MSLRSLVRSLRFDGLWWRKFAYLGSVYFPEWWKRGSPPWIAAIVFLFVRSNRRGAVANMRRIVGSQGWLADHRQAYRMFRAFADCMTETLEHFSPKPQPIRFDEPVGDPIGDALKRGRGVIIVTCHIGNWDVAARTLMRYGGFNLVMAREANETTAAYVRDAREKAGLRILLSDQSVFGSFNMLRALRRNEIVALQLDRPLGGEGSRLVPFFGTPAAFQSGAVRLARLAGAPIIPIFVVRIGTRHYQIVIGTERTIARTAGPNEVDHVLGAIVGEFEEVVRRHPDQWFQFAPFWPEDAPIPAAPAILPGLQPAERAHRRARAR